MAIGHSARDTVEMLYNMGVEIMQKPFSVGARIEHLREKIDKSQYGDFYKGLLKDMKNIVLEKTKITNDEYESHINDDWWISTDEAIRYGIADDVVKTSSVLSLIGGIDNK